MSYGREMTLDEWVDRLPYPHRARQELVKLLEAKASIEAIESVMDCEDLDEFMLSFPVVRKVLDTKAELAEVREALEWYADKKRYGNYYPDSTCPPEILEDRGKRARDALAGR